jgi:hypothetical protein
MEYRYGKIRGKQVVRCYLRQWRTGREDDFWAWEEVEAQVRDTPRRGWALVRQLIAACRSDAALMYIAAGPLENLIKWHGYRLGPKIARAAHDDEKVQRALAGIWIDEEYVAFGWWKQQMIEFGFLVPSDISDRE